MQKRTRRKSEQVEETKLVPPDGKYGWIIVISYAIANFIGIPTTSHFGLIFKDKFAQMQMPAADLTLIININSALSMSLGLINGPLLRQFGYRKISVIAAILFSVGLILTALTNSVIGFIITYGIITAIGYGLSNSSFALALNTYFRDNLNKASGVAMTLAGIGPIVYPPLINYLLHVYDVSGCMLVIGAIALNMLVAAVLLQPLKWHMIKVPVNLTNKHLAVVTTTNLPYVPTFQSIGKFSDSSFMRNDADKTSRFEVNPDIDTQSIYGFDQIVHRQPSTARFDQATIARNFSKRTLCPNPNSIAHFNNFELGLGGGVVGSNQNCFNFGSQTHTQQPPPKPLRWFETGSMNSIHLGSSMEIFKEQQQQPQQGLNQNRRKSSVFMPLRRQTHHAIQTPRKLFRTSHYDDETPKVSFSFDDKADIGKIETDDGVNYLPDIPFEEEVEEKDGCCLSILKWFVHFFDLDLLRDNIYLNIMIGLSISIFAEINFAILTPFILADLNFGADDISTILLVMAIADLISRFCSPFVADHLDLSIRMAYLISLVLLVITRMAMMFTTGLIEMLVVSSALGFAKGIRSVYMSIVIPSYIPIDRLASASAIQLFTNGIIMMSVGPILGLIKDLTGSYVGCILFLNSCTVITVLMYSIELLYSRCKNQSDDVNDTDT